MHHNNSRFLVTVLSKTIWKIIVSKKKIVISLAIIAGLSTPTAFAGEWSIGGSVLSQVTPYKGLNLKTIYYLYLWLIINLKISILRH